MSETETNNSPFDVIYRNRKVIFLAEIGALIHDLGKLSEEFLLDTIKLRHFRHHLILRRNIDNVPAYYTALLEKDAAKLFAQELTKNPNHTLAAQRLLNFLGTSISKQGGVKDALARFRSQNPEAKKVCDLTIGFLIRFYRDRRKNLIDLIDSESDIPDSFIPKSLVSALEAHIVSLPGRSVRCSLADFIEMHHNPAGDLLNPPDLDYDMLIMFCRCCDGLDSGIDKSSPGRDQNNNKFYIASAFGYEQARDNEEKGDWVDSSKLSKIREKFCKVLINQLNQISCGTAKVPEARKNILQAAKDSFIYALGETRRAANDITLWDHSYSVASMFKALFAKMLIENQNMASDDEYEFPERANVRWYILRVTFDASGIIAKGHKLGDILGYREMLERVKEQAKQYIEVDFPVGNEIYRDENGIYFIVPHLKTDDINQAFRECLSLHLSELIAQETSGEFIVNVEFSVETKTFDNLGGEIEQARRQVSHPSPSLTPAWRKGWDELPEQTSRSSSEFRSYLRRYIICRDVCEIDPGPRRKEYGTRYPHPLCERAATCIGARQDGKIEKSFLPQIDECPVCHLRPKCEQQELCRECYTRRKRRVDDWSNTPQGMTIWINEVADHHNQTALIAGRFSLTEWLNGNFVPTIFTLGLQDWLNEKREKVKDEVLESLDWKPINSEEFPYHLAKELWQKFASEYTEGYDKRLNSVLPIYNSFVWPGIRRKEIRNDLFERGMIDDCGTIRNADEAIGILFGKHASPSRIRRIWVTTDKFWDDVVHSELPKLAFGRMEVNPAMQQLRTQRLCIHLDLNLSTIPPALAYEARIGGAQISLFCDGRRLITIDNLQSVMRRLGVNDLGYLKELIKNSSPLVLEPPKRTYGSANTYSVHIERVDEMRSIQIDEVSGKRVEGEDFISYLPYIAILQSPWSFMALVPAEDAMCIVESIKAKYDVEFSKVKSRLPLDLGVFFSPRHLPLYAMMDTAKRWLNAPQAKEESWTIIEEPVNDREKKRVTVKFENGVKWDISYATGDESVPDEYHPLLFVSEGENLTQRRTYFGGSIIGTRKAPYPLIHVTDLQRGDKVQVWPGRFEFEFLDTTTRRFEVSYDPQTGTRRTRTGLFGPRPYYLDNIEKLHTVWNAVNKPSVAKKLSETQKNSIEKLIAFWIEKWGKSVTELSADEVFQDYVESTLKNVGRKSWWHQLTEEEREWLTHAAIDGTLFDTMELFGDLTKSDETASTSEDKGGQR